MTSARNIKYLKEQIVYFQRLAEDYKPGDPSPLFAKAEKWHQKEIALIDRKMEFLSSKSESEYVAEQFNPTFRIERDALDGALEIYKEHITAHVNDSDTFRRFLELAVRAYSLCLEHPNPKRIQSIQGLERLTTVWMKLRLESWEYKNYIIPSAENELKQFTSNLEIFKRTFDDLPQFASEIAKDAILGIVPGANLFALIIERINKYRALKARTPEDKWTDDWQPAIDEIERARIRALMCAAVPGLLIRVEGGIGIRCVLMAGFAASK